MTLHPCISIFFLLTLLSACTSVHYSDEGEVARITSTNESIVLHPVTNEEMELKTVNGEIAVGKGYTIGDVRTVNGEISLGAEVSAKTVRSVNGDISILSGSMIYTVRAVNGNVSINGSRIFDDVRTTNGNIKLFNQTTVEGSVITANGKIRLWDTSVQENLQMSDGTIELNNVSIGGDIIVTEKRFWDYLSFDFFAPKIIIGPNSVVNGKIVAHRRVKLYVHETAKIAGIAGVAAQYYSGDRP